MSTKLPRLKRNAAVGTYRIIQFVGSDDMHALYLASKGDPDEFFWLLESSSPPEHANLAPGERDLFMSKGRNYLAFPVPGTSVATIARMVHSIEWTFIVPRWIALAQQVGFQHANGRVYQQSIHFDLKNILFGERAQLLPLSFADSPGASMPFPAPEAVTRTLTPASDVYSLGAALLELLGEGSPEFASSTIRRPKGQLAAHSNLAGILKKATDPDPIKRYPDANFFASALASESPRALAPKAKSPERKKLQLLAYVPFVVVLLLVLGGGIIWQKGYLQSSLTLIQQPTIALDTPAALPNGVLAFDVANIAFAPDRTGHIDLRLIKGDKPVPYTSPVSFDLEVDGHPVEHLTVEKGAFASDVTPEDGLYDLSFDSSSFSNVRGTYRITAKVIGAALSKTIYFDYSNPNDTTSNSNVLTTDKAGLKQFSMTGVHMDLGRYPDLTLYFGLSGDRGVIGRLKGILLAQLTQDGQDVAEFLITPVDPAQNPVTVALAVDVSGSMKGQPIVKAQEFAGAFVRDLAPKDSACIYTFSTFITRLLKCTADKEAAAGAMTTMEASGDTSIYDALLVISSDMVKVTGRKAIVILSDGADTASQARKAEVLAQLKQTSIPVYAIGLVNAGYRGDVLREITQATGGAYLEAPTGADLLGLYASINNQLQYEYQVDFKSPFPDQDHGTLSLRLFQGNDMIETSHAFSAPAK